MTHIQHAPISYLTRSLGSWEITLRRHPLNHAEATRRYDAAGPGWHRTIERIGVPAAYSALWREVLGIYRPRLETMRFFDCGVGTGAFSAGLAGAAMGPLIVDGIDLSPAMLLEARARLEPVLEPQLRLGDITDLDAATGAYDATGAAHLLEHLADPETGLAEMVRVTRPGGLIVACLTRAGLAGAAVSLRCRTHLFTPKSARALFEGAGLTTVRVRPLGAGLPGRLSLAVTGRKPLETAQ